MLTSFILMFLISVFFWNKKKNRKDIWEKRLVCFFPQTLSKTVLTKCCISIIPCYILIGWFVDIAGSSTTLWEYVPKFLTVRILLQAVPNAPKQLSVDVSYLQALTTTEFSMFLHVNFRLKQPLQHSVKGPWGAQMHYIKSLLLVPPPLSERFLLNLKLYHVDATPFLRPVSGQVPLTSLLVP